MNIDPFFETKHDKITTKESFDSKVGIIGFFLCSFDTTSGLQILFSHPSKLQNEKNETNILKTHCVWKIENIPLRIDLKFSEFIYSAFQLQDPLETEKFISFDRPLYGIVIKKWKDSNPLPTRNMVEFKTIIETGIGSDLSLLYKRKIVASNPIRRREYKELSKKTASLEQFLKDSWKKFVNQLEDDQGSSTENLEHLPDPTKIETSLCAQDLFKQKISMRILSPEEDSNRLMVVLVNQSESLQDVLIHVSKRTEFFSEPVWEQELDNWPLKEDLILEFDKSDEVEKYLIKISSRKTTIDIKSLEVGTSVPV
ncbi:MAG: hypothetical protein JSV04_07005 [Candidatus Heimdallarchaeota archaeon]|nr:MAG: hypothetical protein JSV04_07005 [Candidatus Heimdallarchaeota archaeon]